IRVGFVASHPDAARFSAESAQFYRFLFATLLPVRARLGEDGDLGATASAGKLDELFDERGRLRSTADDHERSAPQSSERNRLRRWGEPCAGRDDTKTD